MIGSLHTFERGGLRLLDLALRKIRFRPAYSAVRCSLNCDGSMGFTSVEDS
jgi:hypothetical protein